MLQGLRIIKYGGNGYAYIFNRYRFIESSDDDKVKAIRFIMCKQIQSSLMDSGFCRFEVDAFDDDDNDDDDV